MFILPDGWRHRKAGGLTQARSYLLGGARTRLRALGCLAKWNHQGGSDGAGRHRLCACPAVACHLPRAALHSPDAASHKSTMVRQVLASCISPLGQIFNARSVNLVNLSASAHRLLPPSAGAPLPPRLWRGRGTALPPGLPALQVLRLRGAGRQDQLGLQPQVQQVSRRRLWRAVLGLWEG